MAEPRSPGTWDKNPEDYYDSPPPEIIFQGSRFILTGVFALGEHDAIEKQVESVGGVVVRVPPKAGAYVVVGTLPTQQWVTSDAGRKLLTALKMREEGHPIRIVGEDYFVQTLLAAQSDPTKSAPATRPDPEAFWRDTLAAWLTPLAQDYEFSLTKSMVVVRLPSKKDARICTFRFGYYKYPDGERIVPTSIDVPELCGWKIDGSQMDYDGNVIDPVHAGKLPDELLKKLKERIDKILA